MEYSLLNQKWLVQARIPLNQQALLLQDQEDLYNKLSLYIHN